MSGNHRLRAAAPDQQILERLHGRVYPMCEQLQRIDERTAVYLVREHLLQLFGGHAEDLGCVVTEVTDATAESVV